MTGESEPGDSVATDSPSQAAPATASRWRQVICAKLALGLTAQRIYQDLVARARLQRQLLQCPPLRPPARSRDRHYHSAGWNVDPAKRPRSISARGIRSSLPDGKRRRTHVFRIVLSHSRKGYSEVVYRQTTDDFLRCLENAFSSLWRRAAAADPRQPARRRGQGRLVRSRAQPQGAVVRRHY